jgi:alanyl-tRNA synthetase
MMTGAEIRSSFIEFFRQRGHDVVRSAPLVPDKDPTLLFTNAGMVQFKNIFLGHETSDNPRVVNVQRCLRLSGKHNDLEEVGRDTYHHTLFEMLGNWSFGDYYKREAINWAWELLTDEWKLPKEKLYATVYRTDDEAESLWRSQTDIGHDRVLRFDDKDNFWEMGDVGPCGPCSEIHIDRGPGTCDHRHVSGHECGVNVGCSRFMELWNLVFIQYNRLPDGSLEELAAKHVDTGAGLERLAAVLQNVPSNYDTDLFRDVIRYVESQTHLRYGANGDHDLSFRVLADHSRALTFMITDGVQPANEGRGYVLRRILRRAARHAKMLGFDEPFLWRLTGPVVELMGEAYPEVVPRQSHIEQVIRSEEERFAETLDKGLALLEEERRSLVAKGAKVLPGAVAFKLYDTFGFPVDMTQDILRGYGMTIDEAGFEKNMASQRQRAREARKGGPEIIMPSGTYSAKFVGDRIYDWESEIEALIVDGAERESAREGEEVQVIVPETPFYGESGGQVGDHGVIETAAGGLVEVVDAQKPRADLIVHVGRVVRGEVAKGERARLRPDRALRDAARLNHSATHILHAMLRKHLGAEVRQAGSLVAPDRLRFDFNFGGPVPADRLERIEQEANERIRENDELVAEEMSYDDAIKAGALAFFGDKYGDRVTVIRIGDYSIELCGGTHVKRAGDIGVIKLRGESGVAAGVRRIEAVSGEGALEAVRERERIMRELSDLVRGNEGNLIEKIERLVHQQRDMERQLQQLSAQLAGKESGSLLEDERFAFTTASGMKVVAAPVDHADPKRLLDMADQLRQRLGSGIVVLAGGSDGKVHLITAVTKDLTERVHAGKLIGQLAPIVGGRGGGRPELAQAGGKDAGKIPEVLRAARELLSKE